MAIAVEINDLCLDLLVHLQNIRRLVNMFAGDLGYMKQSVNARFQLNECAEISHACNSSGDNGADTVLLGSAAPRILIRELHGKSDLLAVDILDQDSDLLANLEDLLLRRNR